jgi:alpha-D-ribose 1-methylphosphonate 5-triphosphate synthase subunit PhnG
MKKSRLTRILVEGNPDLLLALAEQIENKYELSIVRQPEKSLVMNKVRDSVSGQPFYMGEVLITECTVSIMDVFGFGAIMGEQPYRAYQLALVDAAWNAKLQETVKWTPLLEAEEQKMEQKHRQEHSRVMRTKVNFNTMEEYHAKS